MTTEQLRAAIYIRVSQNRNDDRAKPERQLSRCRSLAKSADFKVVTIYDETGSAYSGELPKRDELWKALEEGEIDVVLTLHMDRFLRSTQDMLDFIVIARRTGAQLHTCESGAFDLSTSAGKLVATILAAVAEAESERKSERHTLRNERAILEGKSLGGPPPFGWENPAQTEALRWGIQEYLAGGSLSAIAREWNERGALSHRQRQTASKTGKTVEWSQDAVKKVLIRARNAGLVDRRIDPEKPGAGRQIVEGATAQTEAVCTEDEWRRCVAIATANKRAHRPPSRLLSGLATCSNGHKLNAGINPTKRPDRETGTRSAQYRCTGKGCAAAVRREPLDKLLRDMAVYRLTFTDVQTLAPASRNLERAMSLREELGRLKQERDENVSLLRDRTINAEDLRRLNKPLNLLIDATQEKLDQAQADNAFAAMLSERVRVKRVSLTDAAAARKEVGQKFDALPLDQQRSIVKTLFPKIVVQKLDAGSSTRVPVEDRVTVYLPTGQQYMGWEHDEAV